MSATSRGTKERLDEPAQDDLHLRAVLETQPVTLVRLGRDGIVLAVNDAGLAVIGAESPEQILARSFADLLQDSDRPGFHDFIERVATGHRGSLEVTLTAFTGNRYTIQLHATPHPGAPDGIDSVLVTLQDVTESRRLEQSLVEAMARQADQEAAHEAAREHLAEELRLALQSQGDSEVRLAEIAELKGRLLAAESDHASAVGALTAELEKSRTDLDAARASIGMLSGELEKSRIDVDEARASNGTLSAELEKSRTDVDAARASMRELTEEAAQSRTHAEAMRAALEQDVEKSRVLLETAQADAARQQADIAALRDALNASMNEQADAAARSRLEAEMYAARLTVLETALAAAESARRAVIARARAVTQSTQELAQQISQATAADISSGTPASVLGPRLETSVVAAVDGRLPVTVMVAAPDAESEAAYVIVQQALVALATNRASVVANGQIVVELAAVDIDEGASRSRGGMPCGGYVLVAMHVLATDARTGLAPELFECIDPPAWELAGASLFTAFESMRLARGWIWLAREGASDVVFELYLPRAADRLTETEN